MLQKRKPTRLKSYDYSLPGYYFVTICVKDMKCVFGDVKNNKMKLNKYGKIVENNFNKISGIKNNIEIDEFVIMPNHVHGIIMINLEDAKIASPTNDDRTKMILSKIIQQFKRKSTMELKSSGLTNFKWQCSFYDRIIRNENELFNIRKYISQNSFKWDIEKNLIKNIDL